MTATTTKERPQAITLTQSAADHVRSIMDGADRDYIGLRLGLKSGGCAGFTYSMDYAEEVNPMDEVVEDKGVRVLIDPKAILYLLGTEMDWEENKFESGFVFTNPNEASRCGCGESVSFSIDGRTPQTLEEMGVIPPPMPGDKS